MELRNTPGVYLLHIGGGYKHAMHYLGSAVDVAARVAQHQAGDGTPLTRLVVEKGLTLEVARVWWGAGVDFEYWLKVKYKHSRNLCPICSGEKSLERMVIWQHRVLPKGSRRNRGSRAAKGRKRD